MKTIPTNRQGEKAGVPTRGPTMTSPYSQNQAELQHVEQYVLRTLVPPSMRLS